MPETTPIAKTDIAFATASTGAILVGQGPGQIPLANANLSFDQATQTLNIGAVASVPTVDCGLQGGTFENPTPRTLLKQTPVDESFGSWSLLVESALVSGIINTVTHLAINNPRDPLHPPITSEPSWGIGIEGNWFESTTGRTTVEFYAQLLGPPDDGPLFVGRIQARPIYITADRITGSSRTYIELGKAQSGFGEFGISGSVDKNHANDFPIFRCNVGASAATSSTQIFSPLIGLLRLATLSSGDPTTDLRNTQGIGLSSLSSAFGVEYLCSTNGGGYGFRACAQDPSTGIVYYKLQSRANSATWIDNVTIGSNFTASFAGSLAIGGGTPLKKILSVLAPLDFLGSTAQSSEDLTVTVTGAAVGDAVSVTPPASTPANTSFTGFVSATDTVKVRCNNYSSGAVDPTSGSYRVIVTKF